MIAWLSQNMVWASLLMLVVLAIRLPVARWLGAGAAYALWLAPALRLVCRPCRSAPPDMLPETAIVIGLDAGGAGRRPRGGTSWARDPARALGRRRRRAFWSGNGAPIAPS